MFLKIRSVKSTLFFYNKQNGTCQIFIIRIFNPNATLYDCIYCTFIIRFQEHERTVKKGFQVHSMIYNVYTHTMVIFYVD